MPRIFISYRRHDARYQARSIHDAFAREIGRENVFMDVDSIPPGANFRKILKDWVDRCEVLLALIGPEWIDARDPQTGQRRLDNPSDFVRIEIGEALRRDIRVAPVLLDGAPLPQVHQLPDELKELCDRQAAFVEYRTFDADVDRLIRKLRPGPEWGARVTAAPVPAVERLIRKLGLGPRPVTSVPAAPAPAAPGRAADDGRVEIGGAIVTGAAGGRMLPGNGRSEGFKDQPLAPEMVVIPKGRFIMGSQAAEEGRDDAEGPQHTIAIGAPFALARYAVTLAEFGAFLEATGHVMPNEMFTFENKRWESRKDRSFRNPRFVQTPRHPVVGVSWNDAAAYCQWLSKTTGKGYRLPSESEWEYACRAGTETPFWWGASISTEDANYNGNDVYGDGSKGQYRKGTMPVESFQPNPWGLYQMHGNLWEWCADDWHENFHDAPDDGRVWQGGDETRRVLRGGSWGDCPRYLRAAKRIRYPSVNRSYIIGFRVARTLFT
jgi:formylglycine-generating enzyme required for sulfatase activity